MNLNCIDEIELKLALLTSHYHNLFQQTAEHINKNILPDIDPSQKQALSEVCHHHLLEVDRAIQKCRSEITEMLKDRMDSIENNHNKAMDEAHDTDEEEQNDPMCSVQIKNKKRKRKDGGGEIIQAPKRRKLECGEEDIFDRCDEAEDEDQSNKILIEHLMKKEELNPEIVRSLNMLQKQEMQRGICCLDSNHFDPLVEMLKEFIPDAANGDAAELVLDVDTIDDALQVKMYNYMLKAIRQQEMERIPKESDNAQSEL